MTTNAPGDRPRTPSSDPPPGPAPDLAPDPGHGPDPRRGRGVVRRIAPALGLFLLSPLVAEYLLGNVPASELWGLLLLAPMYGGGAIIIREAARRTGRGWPTILLLGCAYGLLEAGLIDQTLFNPAPLFEDDASHATFVPALGISGNNAVGFIAGHAIWSIGVPIALVESLVPRRAGVPWLGGFGLAVTGVVFVLGSLLIFSGIHDESGFMASAPQRIVAAALVVLLVAAAFVAGRPRTPAAVPDVPGARAGHPGGTPASGAFAGRPRPPVSRRAPAPWQAGAAVFAASAVFVARPENWWGIPTGVALLAAAAVVIVLWSRSRGWGAAHRLASAGGALLTYSILGFLLLMLHDVATVPNLIAQVFLVLGALALFLTARGTVRAASGATVREAP
ncbi:hypothetical protein [Streptosporangium sp. NPDC023615]|uniref:hypothetical protein n=1 Tax=Streptosporangium sp. NPDC023615 TaxID=3154794 RepID=UPI003436A5CA